MGFMKVFNAGDATALHDYISAYTTDDALAHNSAAEWQEHLARIYAATGAMRAVQVVVSDEYRVVVLMQAQTNNAYYMIDMAISEDYPHKVAAFSHTPA